MVQWKMGSERKMCLYSLQMGCVFSTKHHDYGRKGSWQVQGEEILKGEKKMIYLAILCDLFGMVK